VQRALRDVGLDFLEEVLAEIHPLDRDAKAAARDD
jgi:hypothetical protein